MLPNPLALPGTTFWSSQHIVAGHPETRGSPSPGPHVSNTASFPRLFRIAKFDALSLRSRVNLARVSSPDSIVGLDTTTHLTGNRAAPPKMRMHVDPPVCARQAEHNGWTQMSSKRRVLYPILRKRRSVLPTSNLARA
jgi:hypothetical protein